MSSLPSALLAAMISPVMTLFEGTSDGHCVRIDDLAIEDAEVMTSLIRGQSTEDSSDVSIDVYMLSSSGSMAVAHAIGVDRAVELRNRKGRPLLLFVPSGAGHAASSLDNSFERVEAVTLLRSAAEQLTRDLELSDVGTAVRRLYPLVRRNVSHEAWARYLATLLADPTMQSFGRELWQVGLVPDVGDQLEDRLEDNARAVSAVARPSRPVASANDRLDVAGIVEGPDRLRLNNFLEYGAGSLSDAESWTRIIGDRYEGTLTFERWPFALPGIERIDAIKVNPFDLPGGTLGKKCKLTPGPGGERRCMVTPEKPGVVVVQWVTEPSKPLAVDRWRLEVVPPEDLRDADMTPIAATSVKGSQRHATVHIDCTEEDLEAGSLFVVRLTAIDAGGMELAFTKGGTAQADSQDFVVVIDEDTITASHSRRNAVASLPQAILSLAVEGQDDLAEDLPSWDLDGGSFGVRVGERRIAQVRISPLIVALQRQILDAPSRAKFFRVTSPLGMTVKIDAIEASDLELPTAFAEARQKLFASLDERRPRDTIESIAWDEDLRAEAFDYVKKYRRALRDASEPEIIKSLLQLDTLTVTARGAQEWIRGVVLLPTHPLRFAWVAAHDQILRGWADQLITAGAGPKRKLLMDAHLASRVTPANMPFTLFDADAKVAVYAEELTHGTALYLPADIQEPEAAADVIAAVLGIQREGASMAASADLLKQRLEAYQATHPGLGALRFLVINPGSAELLARVIQPIVSGQEDEEAEYDQPPRIEVVGYSDNLPFSDPLARLTDIQRSLLNRPREGRSSHLAPPLGIAARPTSRVLADGEGHHIAVIQDLAVGQIEVGEGAGAGRVPSFQDLLTPLITERIEDEKGGVAWCVGPALKARGGRIGSDIVDAHMQHQSAVGQLLGGGKGVTLRAALGADQLAMVDAVHQRADWVITIDRSIGLDFYGQESSPLLTPGYVLDYAPDFIDGLSNRITVTTAHRPEVLRLLDDAMNGLGLAALSGTATLILDRLQIVSGRLALRLLGDTSLAREAVSLAALIAHLQERRKLDGIIVVPVDAHPEIFGPASRHSEGHARRCDLLLVKLTSRSFNIECVEVKSRKDAALPSQLADRIVEQLTETRDLLINQFFADDPPRVDIELQRSRLAGILHYYADRAAANELIDPDRLPEMHRNIDRIEETGLRPVISLHGYVVSLEGAHGFPESHRGVNISVLTANDLGQAGFTTVREIEERRASTSGSEPDVVPTEYKTTEPPGVLTVQDGGDQQNAPPLAPTSTAEEPSAAPTKSPDPGDSEMDLTASRPADRSESPLLPPNHPKTHESLVKEDHSIAGGPLSATVELGVDAVGVAATWTISTKGSPHAFLLGIPGQGKSVTTRRIIRSFADCHLPSLVFDFHGDMAANPSAGARVIDAATGLPFSPFELGDDRPGSYKTAAWEISEVVAFVSGMGTIQRTSLFNGLVSAYEACGAGPHSLPSRLPTMQEFADSVAATEEGRRAQNARERLIPLTDFGLFAEGAEGNFDPREGVGTIVDVSRLMEAVQLAGGSFILRKIYRDMFRWGQGDRLRLAVILDEAHRLAKDVTLPKLMKEGRKYGVAVVVASQNLTDFHKDVVGNAGTKIVFRTNFPESKQVAGFLKGRRTLDITNEIERLDVGQAFVSTPDQSVARKVHMHVE